MRGQETRAQRRCEETSTQRGSRATRVPRRPAHSALCLRPSGVTFSPKGRACLRAGVRLIRSTGASAGAGRPRPSRSRPDSPSRRSKALRRANLADLWILRPRLEVASGPIGWLWRTEAPSRPGWPHWLQSRRVELARSPGQQGRQLGPRSGTLARVPALPIARPPAPPQCWMPRWLRAQNPQRAVGPTRWDRAGGGRSRSARNSRTRGPGRNNCPRSVPQQYQRARRPTRPGY